MFNFIKKWFGKESNHPIPGRDAHWSGYCLNCKDLTSFASRKGFVNGGVAHCHECGQVQEIRGFREEDIESMVLSSSYHWAKYPMIPYNWHELTENDRWQVLGMKDNVV